ncbi:hypothetical protein N7523_000113 [Penicillium sp. IBT 18751x]|nr:hypothetical protein N7523_000113 [Penicillium sp. IBT 18751x]
MSQTPQSKESKGFKRKRTAHACEECRSRKSRCDGAQPVCDKCTEMGFLCHYSQPKKSSKSALTATPLASDNSIAWIAGRLNEMERLLEKLLSKNDTGTPPYLPYSPPDTLSMQATQSNDQVDGMGCMTFADEGDAGHFGRESATPGSCSVQALLTGNQIRTRPNLECYFPSTYHNHYQGPTAGIFWTDVLAKCRTTLTIRMAIAKFYNKGTINILSEYYCKIFGITSI